MSAAQNTSLPLKPNAESFDSVAPGTPIELIQTHIGYVYLAGDVAYKLKKPVTYDFLDFSTLEKRKWALDRELSLNRRLCPDLYLALFPVIEKPDGSRVVCEKKVEGAVVAPVIDWALKMNRMPLERMLNKLLDENKVTARDVEAIAQTLAPFYKNQRGKIPPGGLGDLDAVTFNINENLREGAALSKELLPPAQLQLIETRARTFLKKYGALIHARAENGFVADGHGDLRAENICLPENAPPLLFDCIEFNDRFRICDSALDIAYLAMELYARNRADLANAFVSAYKTASDPQLSPNLLDFYLGYRAFVKGKVDAWIAGDKGIDEAKRSEHAAAARRYFNDSTAFAIRSEPTLLVFCGISGSGKSTLARDTASRLHATHFSTDLLRDERLPRNLSREERYSPEASARVYGEAFTRAAKQLAAPDNRLVILDGTFPTAALRQRAADLAQPAGARAILVHADCPASATSAHLQERTTKGELCGSEATAEVSAAQRARFEIPSEDESFTVLRIATNVALEQSKANLWNALCETLNAPPKR